MGVGTDVGTVAVIGAGAVGRALAAAAARSGRDVLVGVRDPGSESAEVARADLGSGVRVVAVADAIRSGSIVVLAVPGGAVPALVDEHADGLSGRIVIDATNDLAGGHAPGTLSSLAYLGERVPDAQGYRAFNSIGWENMLEPRFGVLVADLFFAGPDSGSRAAVEALIAGIGFRPAYVGATADAHAAVDALATLWFSLAFGQHRGRRLAFRLLTPDDELE